MALGPKLELKAGKDFPYFGSVLTILACGFALYMMVYRLGWKLGGSGYFDATEQRDQNRSRLLQNTADSFSRESLAAYTDWLALEKSLFRPLEDGRMPDWPTLQKTAAKTVEESAYFQRRVGEMMSRKIQVNPLSTELEVLIPTDNYARALSACVRKLAKIINGMSARGNHADSYTEQAFEQDLKEYKALKLELLKATP